MGNTNRHPNSAQKTESAEEILPGSHSAPINVRELDPDDLLTPYERSILKQAWHRISQTGPAEHVGSLITSKLFSKEPETADALHKAAALEPLLDNQNTSDLKRAHSKRHRHVDKAFEKHAVYFVGFLDEVIDSLEDIDKLVTLCRDYGQRHAQFAAYGVHADHWIVFGEAVVEAAREWECSRRHRETLRAWGMLIAFVVDQLRKGHTAGIRKQHQQRQEAPLQRTSTVCAGHHNKIMASGPVPLSNKPRHQSDTTNEQLSNQAKFEAAQESGAKLTYRNTVPSKPISNSGRIYGRVIDCDQRICAISED